MATMFCLGLTYGDAKRMVQNRTTSNSADDDHEWVGLYGESIEGANLAIINRRKPMNEQEKKAYTAFGWANSLILDQVWPD